MIRNKPRILFTSPILQHPPIGGPALRIENSIKTLHQISDLYIYSQVGNSKNTNLVYYQDYCIQLYIAGYRISWLKPILIVDKICSYLGQKVFSQKNICVPILVDLKYYELLQTIKNVNPDIIWLGYGNISYPLLKFIKNHTTIPVVCDTDSVWSRYILRSLAHTTNQAQKKKIIQIGRIKEEEEKWGTQLADVTTAVSTVDADYYRGFTSDKEKVHVFSNGIDFDEYQPDVNSPEGWNHPAILLAGSFWDYSPMEYAARWFISNVVPYLKQEFSEFNLSIVGKGSDTVLKDINDPNITIYGEVSSVLPYLKNSDLVVVPLKFESGTRFKILEAGAAGIPVISTTLGAEGIPVQDNCDIFIADTPEEFFQAILTILYNKEKSAIIAKNLHGLVKKQYSISSLVHECQRILKYLKIKNNLNYLVNDDVID